MNPALDVAGGSGKSPGPLSTPTPKQAPSSPVKFLPVLAGTSIFLTFQYGSALWRLAHSSGEMANKFSVLAKDKYMGFLVLQNLQMLIAYVVLALAAAFLLQPFVALWTAIRITHVGEYATT